MHSLAAKALYLVRDCFAFVEDYPGIRAGANSGTLLYSIQNQINNASHIIDFNSQAHCSITSSFPRDVWIKSDKVWIINKLGIESQELLCELESKVGSATAKARVSVVKSNVQSTQAKFALSLRII